VGGAPGKIDLYVGKEVVRRGIPMDGATDGLIQLIKDVRTRIFAGACRA
jgi:(E)-4-hydroxy-3-methylbut-2-enyl-diphosphate synthase